MEIETKETAKTPDGEGTSGRGRQSRSRTRTRKTSTADESRDRNGGRSLSRNRNQRRRRVRSRTSSSGNSSSQTVSQTDRDSSGTETSSVLGGGRRRRRNRNKNLYDVLRTHEGLLKQLTAEIRDLKASNRRTEDLANSLSRTTLKTAIEQERGKERRPTGTEQLEAPRLGKADCKEMVYNKALQAFHSSFRTSVNGRDCHSVRELFLTACSTAEANPFSKKQFYQLLRSRVVADSALGAFVCESIRKQTSLRKFVLGLRIYYCQSDTYVTALRQYQEFTGKNMTAKEFLVQLRSVSSDLVETQPGGPRDPEVDEQTLLAHMREKLFTIMPTLAETILNKERSTREPEDSYEFGELLNRYRLRIEANLKGRRTQVNEIGVELLDAAEPTETEGGEAVTNEPPSLPAQKTSGHYASVNSVQEKPQAEERTQATRARTLKLTSEQLNRLRTVCYKCASRSPIQDKDHRSATCLLYKDKALASYVCSRCKIGVHLPNNCLQADDRVKELKERAKELDLPICLDNEVVVNLIEEEEQKN